MGKFCRKVHLARSGKRWLAFLMSVCLIGTMIPITARAETEAEGYVNGFCIGFKFDENGNWVKDTGSTTPCTHGDNCNGYEPAEPTTGEYDIDGDGDKDNQDVAYEISNAGQLYWFAGLVNGTLKDGTKDKSANAILTKPITVNQNVFTENGELNPELKAPRSWMPIGDYDAEYVGTFDGRGNEISGLYYDVTTESYVCAGLFGYVEGGGRVSNVGVADSCFSLKNSGGSVVGGVCGYNKGTIENCYNTGEVTGTAPNSNSFLIGGVCGYNGGPDEDGGVGKIINCHNTGKVTLVCGDEGYVGGVSGCNNLGGTIENCHNTGEVTVTGSGENCIGGVCGGNASDSGDDHPISTIKNCYNTGEIRGSNSVSEIAYVGGVCGYNVASGIENCYNTGNIDGSVYVGGVCGYSSVSTIKNCYFDSGKYNGAAVGCNDKSNGIIRNTEGKSSKQFASGEVCYLLNGSTSDNPVWYQNIDSEGETADAYPLLDSSHGTVYVCTLCRGMFSNTPNETGKHSYKMDEEDNTKHKCENCGETQPHSTSTLTYAVVTGTSSIMVKCGDDCGKEYGAVTLSTPTGDLTYDGNGKTAIVDTSGVSGASISKPAITYSKEGDSSFSGVPTDAGTYTAGITLGTGTDAATVSVTYTITKAASSVGTAPVAKTGLTHTGAAQALVNAGGNVTGGSLRYSTSQNGEYSEAIPTGIDAKEYSVWYKVVGDENHSDTEPVEIKVTIAPKPSSGDGDSSDSGSSSGGSSDSGSSSGGSSDSGSSSGGSSDSGSSSGGSSGGGAAGVPSDGGNTLDSSTGGEGAGATEGSKPEGSDNTTTTTNEDGSTTTTTTETNAAGKEVEVTTTTKTDADGNVTSVTGKSVIDNIEKNTTATVTVKTDGDGNVTSANANITRTGDSSKVSLSGKVLGQITEAAGADTKVRVTMTVKDREGNTKYKVQADADEIIPGETLYIYKRNTKTGKYTMVNAKEYKVTKAGTVTVNMSRKATYELVTAQESKAIEKAILATVKPANTGKSLSTDKTTPFKLSKQMDMDNVKSITYATSRKSIAAISKKGTITAVNAGTATVTATITLKNGTKKTIKMTIKVK